MRRRGLLLFVSVLSAIGCRGPMARIEGFRDALALDDDTKIAELTDALPSCNQLRQGKRPGLEEIANAFGSKDGFHDSVPNQASAATAAVILVREKYGAWVPGDAGTWLASMRAAKGPGADALRLAVARQMALAAPKVGKAHDDEPAARAMMHEVAAVIPGVCITYAELGGGADDAALPPENSADHASCVQRDLGRLGGPGGTYGHGVLRAAAGAATLWKEEARVLREGAAQMDGRGKTTLLAKLAIIDDATAKMNVAPVETPKNGAFYATMGHDDGGAPPPRETPTKPDAGGRRP